MFAAPRSWQGSRGHFTHHRHERDESMSKSDSIPRRARKSFYTYIHRRLDSGQVFYVGKGTRTRGSSSNGRSSHWMRVAEKHGYDIEVIGIWESEAEAFDHERLLISIFRDLGHPLVNKTDGGEGASGVVASESTRIKKSEAYKALRARDPDFDRRRVQAIIQAKRTEEGKMIHSKAMRSHRSTDEARARQSEISKAAWADPEARAHRIQKIAEGRRRLGSEKIAAASRMKFDDPDVRSRVIGALLESNRKHRKQVLCVTTGEVFESVKSAALALGVSRSCIIATCRGIQKTTAGVELKYKIDP